jgi:Mg2+ and Co2+ transporter CorA
MAHVYRFQSLHDSTLKVLATPQPGVWIDVVGMDASDVAALSVAHGLDDGHLVDAQDFYETPRFELERQAAELDEYNQ